MTLKLLVTRLFDPDKTNLWGKMGRVILDQLGNEIGELHPTNSNNWEDGTPINWSDIESKNYNVMVRIPKFYFKKVGFNESPTDFTNGHAWYLSDSPESGYELHPAFMRCRDKLCDDLTGVATEVNYRYAPAFLGWKDGNGKLRSLPFKTPTTNITIGNSRLSAKANGNGWGILDFNLYFAIQLLYAVEYGNYDSQTALGRGYVDGNTNTISTGGTLSNGNKSFGETTGKKQMSYRGIEDFWGNCYRWIDGFLCNANMHMLIGNKGFNDNGNGYIDKGQGGSSNIGGYISNIQSNKDCGFIISSTSSNTNAKLYDCESLCTGALPIAGGSWRYGSMAGAFSFGCSYSGSLATSDVVCSLVF